MISIIVPVYKVEKYLNKCVDSILGQTYKDIEVILVDDGSPDSCGEICNQYKKKDSRIVVIHKGNGGLSDARNAGLQIAKGEYIGFVDSDDYVSPDMYEILITNAIKFSADISMCGYLDVFEGTGLTHTYCNKDGNIYEWNGKEAIQEILTGRRLGVHAPTKLYKRRLFDRVRYPVGKVSEDTYVVMDIFDKVEKAVFIEKPLYYYVHREGSINTSQMNDRDLTRFEAFEKNCNYIHANYPDLQYLANAALLKEKYLVGRKILISKNGVAYSSLLKDITKYLRKNIFNIVRNPNFDTRRKALLVCFAINPNIYKVMLNKKYNGVT